MSKLPSNFRPTLEGNCICVKDQQGELLLMYDLPNLAATLLNGGRITSSEKSAAAAAIVLLLAKNKG